MLDENLPTYRFQPSSENHLNTVLYFSHNGSDPLPNFVLKRPDSASSQKQYALGLLDASNASVIYAEILLKPEWTQPTLSAAESRTQGGGAGLVYPLTPETFYISLYNPDQAIAVRRQGGKWGKTDAWEFEFPERTFKLPSASRIDQDSEALQPVDLSAKVVFKWKRDGRMSRDLTCYMSGRTIGEKKSKEPDITVAFFHAAKNESTVTIYEPNMARVEVEDQKGLEVALLLSAEVIRDLYINPRPDPFNTIGAVMSAANGQRRNSRPLGTPPGGISMSGALNNTKPPSPPSSPPRDPQQQARIDEETRRLKAMVAQEERQLREREKRDDEEQQRIKKMLEKEEQERRRREDEVDKETERLRKEYGVPTPSTTTSGLSGSSPPIPPRPDPNALHIPTGGWYGTPGGSPALPHVSNSVGLQSFPGPSANGHPSLSQQQQHQPLGRMQQQGGGRGKFGNLQGNSPYGGPTVASSSGFFGRFRSDEDKKNKIQRKRSF